MQPFGVCRCLLSGQSPQPGSLAHSRLLFIPGSLLEPVCGATRQVAARASWWHSPKWENMWTHRPVCYQVGKRASEVPSWRLWPKGCVGHAAHGDNKPVHHGVQVTTQRARASLLPWDHVSLGVGQATFFLKTPSNFPNSHVLRVNPPPNQFLLSPGLTDSLHWSSTSPAPFWLLWHMCLSPPITIWHWKAGAWACFYPVILPSFRTLSLSIDISRCPHTQCKKPPPTIDLGLWGRQPSNLDRLSTGSNISTTLHQYWILVNLNDAKIML